jgi:hypothetical protein
MTTPKYSPGPDEKIVPAMFYTPQRMIWGQLLTKSIVRVSTLLQSDFAPKYLDLIDAQLLIFGVGQNTKTLRFETLHIETDQINAYHILPPADESPYFEVSESNRKMESITALIGIYRFDCEIRIAQQSNLKTFLNVQKSAFLPIFNSTMSCPLLPGLKGVSAPIVLIRHNQGVFTPRN